MSGNLRVVVARRIRVLREQKGWSQEELAEMCGLHRTYVGSVERAERNFGIEVLGRLADAFGMPVVELLKAEQAAEKGA